MADWKEALELLDDQGDSHLAATIRAHIEGLERVVRHEHIVAENALQRAEAAEARVRELAIHVRPTCGELYREVDEILAAFGSAAPTGDGVLPNAEEGDFDCPKAAAVRTCPCGFCAVLRKSAAPASGGVELPELRVVATARCQFCHPETCSCPDYRVVLGDSPDSIASGDFDYCNRVVDQLRAYGEQCRLASAQQPAAGANADLLSELRRLEGTRLAIGATPEIASMYRRRCSEFIAKNYGRLTEILASAGSALAPSTDDAAAQGCDWGHNNAVATEVLASAAGWKPIPTSHQFYGLVIRAHYRLLRKRAAASTQESMKMINSVDTLKVLRECRATDARYAEEAFGTPLHSIYAAYVADLDAAIAAPSGGEAVGWAQVDQYGNLTGIRWNSPQNIQDGQPFYTTPRVPDGMVLVRREAIELMREAAEVLKATGTMHGHGDLPHNWRWPLADELGGCAAMVTAAPGKE